jgi:hypothetical protein
MQRLHPAGPTRSSTRNDVKEFIMSVRNTAVILALSAMAAPVALAQTASVFVGGEMGWVDRPVQSSLSRAQVTSEFLAFRSNPTAPDGGQFVGGEAGYIFPQHTYARVNGQWVCTDKIAHNAPPNAIKTDAERRMFLEQYPPA